MYVSLIVVLNNLCTICNLYRLFLWRCKALNIFHIRSDCTFYISCINLSVCKLISTSIYVFHIMFNSIINLWHIPLCIKRYILFRHNTIKAVCTLLIRIPSSKCITISYRNLCNNLCSPLNCLLVILKLAACCIICNIICTSVIVYFKNKTAIRLYYTRWYIFYDITAFIIIRSCSCNILSCCSLGYASLIYHITAILIFKIILCCIHNIIWLFPYSCISHISCRNCITYFWFPACKLVSWSVYGRCRNLCSICIAALRNCLSFWYKLNIVLVSCIIVVKSCASISLYYIW